MPVSLPIEQRAKNRLYIARYNQLADGEIHNLTDSGSIPLLATKDPRQREATSRVARLQSQRGGKNLPFLRH